MTIEAKTIPDYLVLARGNQAEVARQLECDRATIAKYARDAKGQFHAVVCGVLMIAQGGRGKRRWEKKA
ncbi:Phage NinH protein [Cedecea lapagei]|uniref:Phage NinH protein n=1 Tax=Cedecea lapagei TaxID=158823 RepID=A0A447V5S2_9ENTR|nr:protein ninH [Cedecea lapagei]VEB99986.1 Phage NinH protein [Cedecea lapagei]